MSSNTVPRNYKVEFADGTTISDIMAYDVEDALTSVCIRWAAEKPGKEMPTPVRVEAHNPLALSELMLSSLDAMAKRALLKEKR